MKDDLKLFRKQNDLLSLDKRIRFHLNAKDNDIRRAQKIKFEIKEIKGMLRGSENNASPFIGGALEPPLSKRKLSDIGL